MNRRLKVERVAQLAVVLTSAIALKYFYSTASVNQLRWILAPTTFLVELITGERFQFEPFAGYINGNHTFVIAASCAGVNFLLTAFLMLAVRKFWRERSQKIKWRFLPATALVAYVVTVVTNTIRITTAMQLRERHFAASWLSAGQLHRLEGIFVYFGFLLLLYVLSERMSERALDSMSAPRGSNLRWLGFPLFVYYTMTLGIPFVNGSFRHAGFWEHSAFVLLVPLLVLVPLAAFRIAKRRCSVPERSPRLASHQVNPVGMQCLYEPTDPGVVP
ncbi:MAG TPA: exosortase K [Pyrinomonadaceae bacterium]|nr:exosortase K [Pyrinomonadaceae bacterium]